MADEFKELRLRVPAKLHEAIITTADENFTTVNAQAIRMMVDWLGGACRKMWSNSSTSSTNLPQNVEPQNVEETDNILHKNSTNLPQNVESVGGIGGNGSLSNQPEEKTTQPPTARKPREPKEDPVLERHLETLRGIFPAGYKGDLNSCHRHGRRVQEAEWPDVFTGAKRHVDLTPRADLKFSEADVFLRKQLWGRYLGPQAVSGPQVPTVNPHPTDHRDWCRVDRQMGKTALDYQEGTREWMKHRSFELAGDYGSCAL